MPSLVCWISNGRPAWEIQYGDRPNPFHQRLGRERVRIPITDVQAALGIDELLRRARQAPAARKESHGA